MDSTVRTESEKTVHTVLKRSFDTFRNDEYHLTREERPNEPGDIGDLVGNIAPCPSPTYPGTPPTRTPSRVLNAASPTGDTEIYDPKASILLVGFPGAGKHTLGIIISVALRRQYVDFGALFERDVGLAPLDFVSHRGLSPYREAEIRITRKIIEQYRENYVIGGLTGLGGIAQKQLLQSFSATNPIIYIKRDKQYLQGIRGNTTDQDQLYQMCDSFFHSSSTVDFFNITQTSEHLGKTKSLGTLKLKSTETDFIHFVNRVYGRVPRLLKSADPFSLSYTYALEVSLQALEADSVDYKGLEVGADIITLIIDRPQATIGSLQDVIAKQVAMLRRNTRSPILIEAPISSVHDQETYFRLLNLCLRTTPDFLAVDLGANSDQIKQLSFAKSSTKIVGTKHFIEAFAAASRQQSWEHYYDKALYCHCQAIRLTQDSRSVSDNLEVLHEAQRARQLWKLPLICYNTGSAGRSSVCFNPVLSPVQEVSSTSGLTIKQAQNALYSSFILPRKNFTIFGQSVSYSLSPAFHNAAYAAYGLPHSYRMLQSDNFDDIHSLLADADCGGVTVSLPFKTKALAILDKVSPEALEIGAVNTVVVHQTIVENGDQKTEFEGFNTDHIGIRVCIERNISPANSIRKSSTALVIGAGGMARAAIYACRVLSLRRICIFNRTVEHARELAAYCNEKGMDVRVLPTLSTDWPMDMRQPTVVVSCIPAHSIGGQDAHGMMLPEHWLGSRSGGVFIEVGTTYSEKLLSNKVLARIQASCDNSH